MRLPDGTRMRYAVSLPERNARRAPPLVLALHYGWDRRARPRGIGGRFLAELVEPGLGDLGAILVAPDCPGETWVEPGSERALVALVSEAGRRFGAASGRTVVVGYSLGGAGAWFLMARHPELFAGAIAIAANPEPASVTAMTRGMMCAIQSDVDERVPPDPTREAIAALLARGLRADLRVVGGLSHFEPARFVEPLRSATAWLAAGW